MPKKERIKKNLEHHTLSQYTKYRKKDSVLIKGEQIYDGEDLFCPRCDFHITRLYYENLKPTKCKNCGLWMESSGNGLDIWEE